MAFSTSRSRGSRHGSPFSEEAERVLIDSDSDDEYLPLSTYLTPKNAHNFHNIALILLFK